MRDVLRFETMLTPILIQILFWLAVISCFVIGAIAIDTEHSIFIAVSFIILGPMIARVCAEVLIVVFHIHDHLRQIEYNTAALVQKCRSQA